MSTHPSKKTTKNIGIATHVTTGTAHVTSHSIVTLLISASTFHRSYIPNHYITFQTGCECPPVSHVALGVAEPLTSCCVGV